MKALYFLFVIVLMSSGCPKKKEQGSFPFGTWMHSHEEDADPNGQWLIYRPGNYNFPPARGRSGIIVQKDGKFALIGPSAVDGRDTSWGSWSRVDAVTLEIKVEGTSLSKLSWNQQGKGILRIGLK
jgi:hypothetical protein